MPKYLIALLLVISISEATTQSASRFIQDVFFKDQHNLTDRIDQDMARGFGDQKITQAFQDTLIISSKQTIDQVGSPGGYNLDQNIHIPLPREIMHMFFLLDRAGLSGMVIQLEHKINRAAEQAIAQSGDIFQQAIVKMKMEQADEILLGDEDAATRYFQSTIGQSLEKEILPLTRTMLETNGSLRLYDLFLEQYGKYDLFPTMTANIVEHTNKMALEGIFHYLASHEADIRQNPARWNTKNMKTVFGS